MGAGVSMGMGVEKFDLSSWTRESGEYATSKRGNLSRIVIRMTDANS